MLLTQNGFGIIVCSQTRKITTMYYKIVTPNSFFTDLYSNKDVFNIPYGTVFNAPESSKNRPDCPGYLIKENCFHFAEGVFDTMLWHTKLVHHVLSCQIYAVQPLTDVIKQRCNDDLGLYQCGAQQIKFLEKQDIGKMYDVAVKEYESNLERYQNFKISIDCWRQHKTTCFFCA